MKRSIIEKLCCPFDKKDVSLLVITQDESKQILEGILTCSHCQRIYPIISGIPIMNPDEYRNFKLEQPLLEKWEEKLGIDLTGSPKKGIKKLVSND